MSRRFLPKAGAALAALAALALAGPAGVAHAAAASPAAAPQAAPVPYMVTQANPVINDKFTYWVFCRDGSSTVTVYHQFNNNTCGGDDTLGFASMTTNANGSHSIEVCDLDAIDDSYFTEVVNPANPDGTATGQTIWYTDLPNDGHCYLRTLGYPVRKFQVTADGQGFSAWVAPL
jgi:hypothetical protein